MTDRIAKLTEQALAGGPARYRDKLGEQNKLFVRERLRLLLDEGATWSEDSLLANALAGDLGADGVVTGIGQVGGRPVCVMANDPTVKAGSWGARTVEKIVRITETALHHELPIVYLVDSAGARITDQVQLFPGRRGAGRIFANQVRLSGRVPQVCCLFGPSAAGGAYIPSFCDVIIMVEGNASMYLGSARMVEMVTREKTTLEEMGGARLHATVSGCGSHLVKDDAEAIALARRWLSYFPSNWKEEAPVSEAVAPARTLGADDIPADERKVFDMRTTVVDSLVDAGSLEEYHPLWARELLCGLARIDGRPVGVVASQPMVKGGVLFVDSADKGARFIWLCDAFNIPLLFLADVPGFMVGTQVEREGIIRSGAKMITAVTEATVPKVSVIVRKAYGAGLYAMCGPAFDPVACLALPTAKIAVMGAEAAVNAVYFNHIEALPEGERADFVAQKRAEYEEDIDITRLASEMVVDAVIEPADLRAEIVNRLSASTGRRRETFERRHGVPPG